MGLLPMGADILPPSDDRVFKLILTKQEAKPVLIDLVSSIIKRPVVDVEVRNSEIPPDDTHEKAERLVVTSGPEGQKHILSVRSPLLSAIQRCAEIRQAGPDVSGDILLLYGVPGADAVRQFLLLAA